MDDSVKDLANERNLLDYIVVCISRMLTCICGNIKELTFSTNSMMWSIHYLSTIQWMI